MAQPEVTNAQIKAYSQLSSNIYINVEQLNKEAQTIEISFLVVCENNEEHTVTVAKVGLEGKYDNEPSNILMTDSRYHVVYSDNDNYVVKDILNWHYLKEIKKTVNRYVQDEFIADPRTRIGMRVEAYPYVR